MAAALDNFGGIERITSEQIEFYLGGRSFSSVKQEFDEAGYIVIKDVLSKDELASIRSAVVPWQTRTGRNDFEGHHSTRVYALLAKAPDTFSKLVTHPLALGFAEAELGSSCLLSALIAIDLHPGETVQPWHRDDGNAAVPMPRPAFGISVFWAIDQTNEENGATQLVPGSHLFSEGDTWSDDDAVTVSLPAGSVMIMKGNMLHRGGANRSPANRLIITPQYCGGWLRQIENMMAAVPKDVARDLPKRVRELLGYNIHGAFMGYVDGIHPDNALNS